MSELVWGLNNWQFWLSGVWFLLITFLIICPSGFLLLRSTRLNLKWRTLLSFPLGIILWGFMSWVACGVANLQFDQHWGFWLKNGLWLNYLFIGATLAGIYFYRQDFFDLKNQIKKSFHQSSRFYRRQIIALSMLILLGLIIQLPAVSSSGLLDRSGGVSFYFTNIPDGVMHLSFIESMQQHLPPIRPEVTDANLLDYHYFSDLFVARLGQVFHLPTFNLFFQYLPLMISAWCTLLIFQIVLFWTTHHQQKSSLIPAIFVTLVFLLAGDSMYLMELYWRHRFNFGTPTFDNGAEQFLNMPQMYAKLIFLSALILWQKFIQPFFTQNKKQLTASDYALALILILTVSLLTYYKIYFAILFFVGWGFGNLYLSYKHFKTAPSHKNWSFFYLNWGSLFLSAIFAYLIIHFNSSPSESLLPFAYSAWIWPKIIIGDSHLGMGIWLLERETFLHNLAWFKVFKIDLKIILTSLIAIYGLRLLGFFPLKKNRQILSPLLLWFFIPGFLIFTYLGMNFVQVKGGLNTFNFFIITCIGLNFILGLNLSQLWQISHRWLKFLMRILVIFIMILLSLRTGERWWSEVSTIYQGRADKYFNQTNLEALNFMRHLPADTVIQPFIDYGSAQESAYITAFTGHQTYLSNQNILGTHNFDYSHRQAQLQTIFNKKDLTEIKNQLQQLKVNYLYTDTITAQRFFERTQINPEDWMPIFINRDQIIYSVN